MNQGKTKSTFWKKDWWYIDSQFKLLIQNKKVTLCTFKMKFYHDKSSQVFNCPHLTVLLLDTLSNASVSHCSSDVHCQTRTQLFFRTETTLCLCCQCGSSHSWIWMLSTCTARSTSVSNFRTTPADLWVEELTFHAIHIQWLYKAFGHLGHT